MWPILSVWLAVTLSSSLSLAIQEGLQPSGTSSVFTGRSLLRREDPVGRRGSALSPEDRIESPQHGPGIEVFIGAVQPESGGARIDATTIPPVLAAAPQPESGTTIPPVLAAVPKPESAVAPIDAGTTVPPILTALAPPISPPPANGSTSNGSIYNPPVLAAQITAATTQVPAAVAAAPAAAVQGTTPAAPVSTTPVVPSMQTQAPPVEKAAINQQTPGGSNDDEVRHRMSKRHLRALVFCLTMFCVLLVWEQSRMMWGIDCCCRKIDYSPRCPNTKMPLIQGVSPEKEAETLVCSSCQRKVNPDNFFSCGTDGCTSGYCGNCYDKLHLDRGCWYNFCTCKCLSDKRPKVIDREDYAPRSQDDDEDDGRESGAEAESKNSPAKDDAETITNASVEGS